MAILVLAGSALLLLLASAPVFIAILAPTLLSFDLFGPPVPTMALTQQMMQGINKFSLLAIPLFMYSPTSFPKARSARGCCAWWRRRSAI